MTLCSPTHHPAAGPRDSTSEFCPQQTEPSCLLCHPADFLEPLQSFPIFPAATLALPLPTPQSSVMVLVQISIGFPGVWNKSQVTSRGLQDPPPSGLCLFSLLHAGPVHWPLPAPTPYTTCIHCVPDPECSWGQDPGSRFSEGGRETVQCHSIPLGSRATPSSSQP